MGPENKINPKLPELKNGVVMRKKMGITKKTGNGRSIWDRPI